MPYIRHRGPYAVLVHCVRRGGKVVQRHLAYLGRRIRIEPELRRRLEALFPDIAFDWAGLESRLKGKENRGAKRTVPPVKGSSAWLEED